MKILWITNTLIGGLYEKINKKPSNGVWMDALLADFITENEHKLTIVTTGRNKKIIIHTENNITYYLLPGGLPIEYNHKSSTARYWNNIFEDEKPDIIQIWGSEFKHGLAALKAAHNIPSVVYMQGILDSIARYYEAGIEYKVLQKTVTFRDIIKHDSILQQKHKYEKRAFYEKELLSLSGNIISENDCCDAHVKAIVLGIKSYRCPLSINKVFAKVQWNAQNCERYSIICNASGYPLKGLHMILRAVALVKREYPDIKIYVPGMPQVSDGSPIWLIRKRGYTKYIEKLIKELNIEKQIIWLGDLSQNELAIQLSKKNVFILGSVIENHSSTLKEAMMVGIPCVASAVGGIPEYVMHSVNGLLYRFEEYELLAKYITDIFEDDSLAEKLSVNGKQSMLRFHGSDEIYKTITDIYKDIVKG